MRIAHLADSHLDEKQDLEDNLRVHRAAIEQIRDAEPDLILHAGDLHNRLSSPAVREAGLWVVDSLAAIAPVVLVRGNHDRPGDLAIYRGRRTDFTVHVFEQAGVYAQLTETETGLLPVQVLALPWIDKAQAAAQLEGSIAETDDAVAAMVGKLLETMRAWAAPPAEGITIGVGHLTIGGSILSTGQTLIGKGLELNAGDLMRSGAGLWALGHIHKRQGFVKESDDLAALESGVAISTLGAGKQPEEALQTWRVLYAGSVQRLNFGEPEAKSWTLHLLEHDPEAPGGARIVSQEIHALPAQRIERIEWTLEDVQEAIAQGPEGLLGPDGSGVEGARTRVRFRVRPDELAALDLQRLEDALLAVGAQEVKLEPIVEHGATVRSEEVKTAKTLWDAVAGWLELRAPGLDPDQRVRLQDKLVDLEGGAR